MNVRSFESFRFRHPWREYQARALENYARHAEDGHFHVVAAPGSGKTVLGLELVRIRQHPALILAPTTTIREQWIYRLQHDFRDSEGRQPSMELISRDPLAPAALTIVTYQGFSAIFKKGARAKLFRALREAGVLSIVVDEAHHLRRFWWKCLRDLKESMEDPFVVALTATPPVDVTGAEWNRYASFCGPVDAEIRIPELVLQKNLCPHHDFVYLSVPKDDEASGIERFHRRVDAIVSDVAIDTHFATLASRHFGVHQPDSAEIFARQRFFLALLIFVEHGTGHRPGWLDDSLGTTGVVLPQFDRAWISVLFDRMLFDKGFMESLVADPELAERIEDYEGRFRSAGAIDRKRLQLDGSQRTSRLLRNSRSKIDAVCEIVEHEFNVLGVRLRAVVLADRIRIGALELTTPVGGEGAERLGVIPIFQRLRRMAIPGIHPAVLTGSLILLPRVSLPFFEGALGEKPSVRALDAIENFVRIDVSDSTRRSLVAAVTQVFQDGHVNVLIGTTALLGEGWDAPALNTLILASAIGSYVTSNQMRGRAIRIWAEDPDKTANIWHLACIDTGTSRDRGDDFETLRRRFDGYAGLNRAQQPPTIEEGFARLGLSELLNAGEAKRFNTQSFNAAENRAEMALAWERALPPSLNSKLRPVSEIAMSSDALACSFSANKGGIALYKRLVTGKQPTFFLHRWIRHYLLRRRVMKLAAALMDCLVPNDSGAEAIPPASVALKRGQIQVTIRGASPEFARTLSQSLLELFDLNRTVRYVLVHQGVVYGVPEALEAKPLATRLLRAWEDRVGSTQLFYTGVSEGRQLLLNARTRSMLSQDEEIACDTRVRWEVS